MVSLKFKGWGWGVAGRHGCLMYAWSYVIDRACVVRAGLLAVNFVRVGVEKW